MTEDNYWLTSYYMNASTVENLDDNSLVEECMHINDANLPELDGIYSDYILTGRLDKSSRRTLEYYYIIYYTTPISYREH